MAHALNKQMKKYQAKVPGELDGERLDKAFAGCFGAGSKQDLGLSRRQFRDLITEGAAYINGRRQTRLSQTVRTGDQLEFYWKGAGQDLTPSEFFRIDRSVILFEDDDLIFINKPPGLPSQPTLDSSRHNLYAAVQSYVRETSGADAYVGMHQRLDRDTSGVIFFTKTRTVNKAMAEQVSGHQIQKLYWALCSRRADVDVQTKEFSVRDHLQRSQTKPIYMQAVHSGGDLAETDFTILQSAKTADWIEARPRTGRMHQIRVHLASVGRAIFADTLYHGPRPSAVAPRIMLHAHRLEIRHPVSGERLVVVAPEPSDFKTCWGILKPVPC